MDRRSIGTTLGSAILVLVAAVFFATQAPIAAAATLEIEGGAQRQGVVGEPATLNWRINAALPTNDNLIDLLVVSLPHSVRLAGGDFYVYPPGEPMLLGLSLEPDRFRAVYPLYLMEPMDARELEIRFYQTGAHRIAVSHITVDRRGGSATVRSRQEIAFDIADARPRLIVSDVARADSSPRSRTLAPDGKTRVVAYAEDFEIRDTATDLALLRLAGTAPAYSPTGRFVTFNTGSVAQDGPKTYMADVQALEVFHLAYGMVHGWARGDAVLLTERPEGQAGMPGIQIVDTFVNRHLRDDEPQDESAYSRVDVDRQFPLRTFNLFACMACDNQDTWFRMVPEYGVVAYSFSRDHSEPATRAGDEMNAELLLAGHYARPTEPGPSGLTWQQGAQPEFIPSNFAVSRGWNVGAPLTPPAAVGPSAQPVASAEKPGEIMGHVVRGLPVGGETVRRTLDDQLFFAFGVKLMQLSSGEPPTAPPSATELQRLGTAAKSVAPPYDEYGDACRMNSEACASPFLPTSWSLRMPDGRVAVVEFADLGGGATGRIQNGEIWLGIAGPGRATALRLAEASSSALASDLTVKVFGSKFLVVYSRDTETVSVVDLATEKIMQAQGVDWWNAARVTPLADRPILMQENHDGALYFYDLNGGRIVLRGQFLDDELVLFTEDGRFDATGDGARHARLLFAGRREHHTLAQFRQVLYDPKTIAESLLGRAPAAAAGAAIPIPPGLDFRVQPADAAGGHVLRAAAQGDAPLKFVAFYLDGLKIAERPLQGRNARVEDKLAVPTGGHWLTAVVADQRGLLSAAKTSFVSVAPGGAQPPGALHMLAIGINQYPSAPQLGNLAAAVPDAVALAEAARRYGGKQYRAVSASVLRDNEATGAGILRATAALVEQAAPGDTVLLFVAGHGVRDEAGNFYLVAHDTEFRSADATGGRRLLQTALPWTKIGEIFAKSRARILVLLDTCHSGTAGDTALASNDAAVKAMRAAGAPGIMILAAAKGRQLAQEKNLAGGQARGVFAHAVELALGAERQNADLDKNGVIEASELYRFVKFKVWQETQGLQTPWMATSAIEGEVALF